MPEAWCYSTVGEEFSNTSAPPDAFYVDTDHFIATTALDPLVPWYDQGWWYGGYDHCTRQNSTVPGLGNATDPPGRSGRFVGMLPFPVDWTVAMYGNNAAAVLLPDNETLVQMQPLVRCVPGGPIFSLSWQNFIPNGGSECADNPAFDKNISGLPTTNASILGEGTWGAHGGSRLSSIGGTIRLGELLPGAPPVPHAIKLMLWGAAYFWPGNSSTVDPCYRWPALNCDCWSVPSVRPGNVPANGNYYAGSNPKLKPGALLAVPAMLAERVGRRVRTVLGHKMLTVLTDYGGYIDDDTAANSAAYNVEPGVTDECDAAYGGVNVLEPRACPPGAGAVCDGPGSDYYHDLLAIFQALHIVDNNGPGRHGGGGAPRRPPAPPICGAPSSTPAW